jgi:capsular polysaccharide export protein
LSAIHQGAPLKVCGNALYDMPGLTFQGSLNDFWKNAQINKPESLLMQAFHRYLVKHTQINGNFYKRLPSATSATGLRWVTNVNIGKQVAAVELEAAEII